MWSWAFKRLGQRLTAGLSKAGLLVLGFFFFAGGQVVEGNEDREIDRILAHDDFKEDVRTVKRWEPDASSSSRSGSSSGVGGFHDGAGADVILGNRLFGGGRAGVVDLYEPSCVCLPWGEDG